MKILNNLERRFGKLAVPDLSLVLACTMGVCFGLSLLWPGFEDALRLRPDLVLKGEFWRLFSFMILPPSWHPVFVVFALYLFYLMGSALEAEWGEFRYNIYILVGYLGALMGAFLSPNGIATNAYIFGSVFLAFAYLYPDFVIYVFFILPVKVKWLALLTWIGYGLNLLFGDWMTRFLVVAGVANFLLFFGQEILLSARSAKRRMEFDARKIKSQDQAFHHCAICKVTEITDPTMEFRVCTECQGSPEYCIKHIDDHTHV